MSDSLEEIVMEVASLRARRDAAIKRRDELSRELTSTADSIGAYEVAIRDITTKLWKEARIRLEGQEKRTQDAKPPYGLLLGKEYDKGVLALVPLGGWISDCDADLWEYIGNKKWDSRNAASNNLGEITSEYLAQWAPFKVTRLPQS